MASNVNNSILELYESAIANDSEVSSNKEILMWISEKKKKANFVSKEVPLNELNKWSFDNLSGNLLHKSGGFFSVAGVSIETNWGENSEWTQQTGMCICLEAILAPGSRHGDLQRRTTVPPKVSAQLRGDFQ